MFISLGKHFWKKSRRKYTQLFSSAWVSIKNCRYNKSIFSPFNGTLKQFIFDGKRIPFHYALLFFVFYNWLVRRREKYEKFSFSSYLDEAMVACQLILPFVCLEFWRFGVVNQGVIDQDFIKKISFLNFDRIRHPNSNPISRAIEDPSKPPKTIDSIVNNVWNWSWFRYQELSLLISFYLFFPLSFWLKSIFIIYYSVLWNNIIILKLKIDSYWLLALSWTIQIAILFSNLLGENWNKNQK